MNPAVLDTFFYAAYHAMMMEYFTLFPRSELPCIEVIIGRKLKDSHAMKPAWIAVSLNIEDAGQGAGQMRS
jgi:hypothetical protein